VSGNNITFKDLSIGCHFVFNVSRHPECQSCARVKHTQGYSTVYVGLLLLVALAKVLTLNIVQQKKDLWLLLCSTLVSPLTPFQIEIPFQMLKCIDWSGLSCLHSGFFIAFYFDNNNFTPFSPQFQSCLIAATPQ
jgi:hypothetical protein